MKIKYWVIVISLVCLSGCTAALVSALTPNGGGSSGLTSLLVLLGINRPSGGSNSYSISSAFSYTSNPNGVWRYGWKSTATGSLTLYSLTRNNGGFLSWYYTSSSNPSFARNDYQFETYGVKNGEVSLHPGSSGQEISVLRWTAPQAGTISIKGSFKSGDTGSVDVYVLKNTTTLFSKTSTLISESFDQTTTVAIGDTIDFQVGSAGSNAFDSTPIDGVIKYTSTTDMQVCTVSTLASLNSSFGIVGVAVDNSGTIFVTEEYKVSKITSTGVVTTFAGSGSNGSSDGTGTAASFYGANGVGIASNGNVYISDCGNNRIRKITSAGVVTTLAGSGSSGSSDGTGGAASFFCPIGLAVDNNEKIYIADQNNYKIRTVTSSGVVTTLAGSGSSGSTEGTDSSASFAFYLGLANLAVDINGSVYVADTNNNKIRKITSSGVVTTLAGSGSSGSSDGTGVNASFNKPVGVAVDSSGNVYVGGSNSGLRKITSSGAVTTIASTVSFGAMKGVAVDSNGAIYAVNGNNILKIVCQ